MWSVTRTSGEPLGAGKVETTADRLAQCALAIVNANSVSPIDLSRVNIVDSDTVDYLARRVTIQSGAKYSIRRANKDLFGGLEVMGQCLYMARVPNMAYARYQEVTELTDDIVLFRLTPTRNGLRIPVPPRQHKPENLAEFRERVATSDAVTSAPENVTEWNVQTALGTAHDLTDLVLITLDRHINEVKDGDKRRELKRVLERSDRVADLYLSDILVVCALLNIDLADILKQTPD
jgi:hypothetical protein